MSESRPFHLRSGRIIHAAHCFRQSPETVDSAEDSAGTTTPLHRQHATVNDSKTRSQARSEANQTEHARAESSKPSYTQSGDASQALLSQWESLLELALDSSPQDLSRQEAARTALIVELNHEPLEDSLKNRLRQVLPKQSDQLEPWLSSDREARNAWGTILVEGLLSHETEKIQAARKILSQVGIPERSWKALVVYSRAPDWRVRLHIMQSLEILSPQEPPPWGELALLLQDPVRAVREKAEKLLISSGVRGEDAFVVASWVLEAPDGAQLRRRLRLMGKAGPKMSPLISFLLPLLADREPANRLLATETLPLLGWDTVALPVVLEMARHPHWEIRRHLAEYLARLGPAAAAASDIAVTLMSDEELSVREKACEAVRRMGFRQVSLPVFGRLMTHRQSSIRLATVEVLGGLGSQAADAAGLVAERWSDSHPDVREAAYRALLQIGFRSWCVPALASLQEDRRQGIRLRLLEQLALFGKSASPALPIVVALLADKDFVVREAAMEAVVSIGFDPSVIGELAVIAQDPRREVRLNLLHLLEQLGPAAEATIPLVANLQKDRDGSVVDAAYVAMSAILPPGIS